MGRTSVWGQPTTWLAIGTVFSQDKRQESSLGSLNRGSNPIREGSTPDLITSKRFHLRIPSHGVQFQSINLGGHKHPVYSGFDSALYAIWPNISIIDMWRRQHKRGVFRWTQSTRGEGCLQIRVNNLERLRRSELSQELGIVTCQRREQCSKYDVKWLLGK